MTNLATPAIERTAISARFASPVVKNNEITFSNSKGKSFVLSHENGMFMDSYTIDRNVNWAMALMSLFNKFYDEKSRNIPAGKIFDIGSEIEEKFPPLKGGRGVTINWNQVLRNTLSDMTNPNSDGGVNITENEIYDYYERCAKIIRKDSYFSLREK